MRLAKENSSRCDLYEGRKEASEKRLNSCDDKKTQGLVRASVALEDFETHLRFLITAAPTSVVIKFYID